MLDTLRQILSDPILDDRRKVRAARVALGQLERHAARPVTRASVMDDLDTLIADASAVAGAGPLTVALCVIRDQFADARDGKGAGLMDAMVAYHQTADSRRN